MGDLINATLAKYNRLYNLPIINLSQHDLGGRMANRMVYDNSGVKATLNKSAAGQCTMTVSTVQPATIPVTGPVTGTPPGTTTEVYGGQTISYVPLAAGGSAPLTLPASACQ